MPIAVTCPECESVCRVADEMAGKAIRCKRCGARVPIPAGSGGKASDDERAGEPAAKQKGGAAPVLIVGGAVLAVACCLCLPLGGVATYYFWPQAPVAMKDLRDRQDVQAKDKDSGKAAKGKMLLEKTGVLSNKDLQDAGKPYKPFEVNLEQGKIYVIELTSTHEDHYLRLYDPNQKRVAEDGTTPVARITHMARQSGKHQIRVTTFKGIIPPQGVEFSLTVRER
jgi:hypothetical protein